VGLGEGRGTGSRIESILPLREVLKMVAESNGVSTSAKMTIFGC